MAPYGIAYCVRCSTKTEIHHFGVILLNILKKIALDRSFLSRFFHDAKFKYPPPLCVASAKSRKEEERKREKGKLTSSPNLISDGAPEEKKRKKEESPFFSQSAKGVNDMERCKKSILTPPGGGPLTTEQKKVYMPKCSQCHEKITAVTYLPYIFYRKISTKAHCLIFLQNL